jgi:hypothetical protein
MYLHSPISEIFISFSFVVDSESDGSSLPDPETKHYYKSVPSTLNSSASQFYV